MGSLDFYTGKYKKCKYCVRKFNVYHRDNTDYCSERCEMEDCNTWRYWRDIKTNRKYEIDFDTHEGTGLANDPEFNLVKISEKSFRSSKL